MKRLAQLLVMELIFLAPWGGPCDRLVRAADPITAAGLWVGDRFSEILGLSAVDPLRASSPLPAHHDILEGEAEGEGLVAFWPMPWVLLQCSAWGGETAPALLGSADRGRSPILRC